jgi:glycolate oxidase FAD binding subunit
VDDLQEELAHAGVAVRPAEQTDSVDGVQPQLVASPTDTAGVSTVLRVAARKGLAVVARGTGSKLDWGLPPTRLDVLLDTSRMNRLLDHAAGDLVVQAQAGIELGSLRDALAEARQRLALDPVTNAPGTAAGTLGGTIATAADGPLRQSHGSVRDLLIGVTMVRADGAVAHAGGRVVKNVAGYDLGKLLTGSWGTLGIVTEAIFRLHPRPEAARWVTYTGTDAAQRAISVAQSQLMPAAVEIDRPAGGEPTVAALVDGFPAGVDARAAALQDLLGGEPNDTPPSWWGRAPWQPEATVLRLTSTLTGVLPLLDAVDALPVPAAVRGSAGVAKLYVAIGAGADPRDVARSVQTLRERAGQWGGDVVVLRAPGDVRAAVDSWGPVSGLQLMRRIKHEFDPESRLAPGRFVGGI